MIRLRSLIKRQSRSLLIGGALAVVCLALALAHSAPAGHEMSASGDEQMADIVSVCLAVLQVTGGMLAAAILGAVIIRRWRPPRMLGAPRWPGLAVGPDAWTLVAARAGPAELQVFRR
jgi:hypothetical protein